MLRKLGLRQKNGFFIKTKGITFQQSSAVWKQLYKLSVEETEKKFS